MTEKQINDGLTAWRIYQMQNPGLKGIEKQKAEKHFAAACGIMSTLSAHKKSMFLRKLMFWKRSE